jgi:hypothetical protein
MKHQFRHEQDFTAHFSREDFSTKISRSIVKGKSAVEWLLILLFSPNLELGSVESAERCN